MKNIGKKLAIGVGIVFGLFVLLAFLGYLIGPQPKREKKSEKQIAETKVKPPEPERQLTDSDYVHYFQLQWDSIKLYKENGYLQYRAYYEELDRTLTNINLIITSDSINLPKLVKLRNKYEDVSLFAFKDYAIYGNPYGDAELQDACEYYLDNHLKDPGSLDVMDFVVKGKSKTGWITSMKYRAKNSFGAKVIEVATFDIRFNIQDKMFHAVSAN